MPFPINMGLYQLIFFLLKITVISLIEIFFLYLQRDFIIAIKTCAFFRFLSFILHYVYINDQLRSKKWLIFFFASCRTVDWNWFRKEVLFSYFLINYSQKFYRSFLHKRCLFDKEFAFFVFGETIYNNAYIATIIFINS